MATGIETRHSRTCRSRRGGRCNCEPSYQAFVYEAESARKLRKTFPTKAAAKAWRQDAQVALRQGTMRATSSASLDDVVKDWLAGAESGLVRNRSGEVYKPSAVRGYEASLRLRVLPKIGRKRLSDVRRHDVQDLVDELVADGLAAATIQATLIPLKAVCRREVSRGRLAVNPTTGLELPAVRGGRDRIADPAEAAKLLAALPEADRAVWATALYGGLRRGELMALRADRIDLTAGVIHVDKGWDVKVGEIETKGKVRRRVPIASALREELLGHLMRSGRRDRDLVFGKTTSSPFAPTPLRERADEAWTAAKLRRITLHECRHTFASLMIAAGVNAKALSTYMGHANIGITLDRYGHLMPGNEEEAAGLLDGYLQRALGT